LVIYAQEVIFVQKEVTCTRVCYYIVDSRGH
jgi:hypothetical protein